MKGSRTVALALLVAALQIGFLGWMIAGRAAVLRNGPEALLKVEPVDPRDLLRGDYVRLGFDISRIPVALVSNLPQGDAALPAGPIMVRIGRDADGYWRARSAMLGNAAALPVAGELDVRGMTAGLWRIEPGAEIVVSYGIERFYVPEGEGRQIEKDLNIRNFGVVVALAADGTPQIKALMDGDVRVYEEPPY
jgi:uncharacterized membrane-anchored protein